MRATFYSAEADYDAALEDLDAALEIFVDDPYLIGEIIAILIQMDDLKTAHKELRRLTKLEDGYPVILFYEGLLAYAEGELTLAEDLLSEFIALNLNNYLTLEAESLLIEIQTQS